MAKLTDINEKKSGNLSFEDAIQITGYGRFNMYILLAGGLCLMCVIIETMSMMFIIPAAQCDLKLSLSQKGLLSSISFLGVVSSGHLWGFIADTKGRRQVLLFSLVISSLLSFICSIVPWSWLFILLRFLNGFIIGGSSSVVYAYVGEFHDQNSRPKVVSGMGAFVALGNMFLPGLAWIILPKQWKFFISTLGIYYKPWRLLVIIYALPSVISAIFLYLLPESPKYLLTQGKHKQVLFILRKMYSINNKGSTENDYPVSQVCWNELGEKPSDKKDNIFIDMWKQTLPLFRGPLLRKTLMTSALQFGLFASNSGVVMWYPEIVNRMSHYIDDYPDKSVNMCSGFSNEETNEFLNTTTVIIPVKMKICKDVIKNDVFMIALIIATAYVVSYIFVGIVINIFGKINLLVGFLIITTITGLLSHFVYEHVTIQILIGIFLMGGVSVGILNAIIVDLYPTQVRAMALAISLMFGRLGAMTGSNIVGPVLHNLCNYLFVFITFDHILMIVIVFFLPRQKF